MLRDAAVAFCGRDTSIARIRKHRWEGAGYDRRTWEQMAELGWLGILIPEQYGGMGLGLGEMRAVAEELARALVPEPLNATAVLAARAILHGDNEELKKKLLPQIAEGKLIVALAWQEKLAGLDFKSIAAKATKKGSGVIIRAVRPCHWHLPGAAASRSRSIHPAGVDAGRAGRHALRVRRWGRRL
jgi:alkylation response protein AidB-like acyl-CoA dehydrogenase